MSKWATTVGWLLLAWCQAAAAGPDAEPGGQRLAELSTPELSASGQMLWNRLDASKLKLRSGHALVIDQFGNVVYAKAAEQPVPIASITKLMTAIVTLDAGLDPGERITISDEDRDTIKYTGSRLRVGATLSREELLLIALMSSENRAASALTRSYPGGRAAFVQAMNRKAKALDMAQTRFVDGTGLDARNVSTARDLARLVGAAAQYPQIAQATTAEDAEVRPYRRRGPLHYQNSNRLVGKENWPIRLSKTGYINEAGRCLVMSVEIAGAPLVVVLLDSFGKLTPLGDSNRLRNWIELAARRDQT